MIGRLLGFVGTPVGAVLLGAATTFGGFQVGKLVGYAQGEAAAQVEQAEINAEQAAIIQERVRNALDQIGADVGDDDIQRILRGLAASE